MLQLLINVIKKSGGNRLNSIFLSNSTCSFMLLEENFIDLTEQFSVDKVWSFWIPSRVTLANILSRVPKDPGYQVESEKKTQLTKKVAVVGLCHKMCKSCECAAAQELLI